MNIPIPASRTVEKNGLSYDIGWTVDDTFDPSEITGNRYEGETPEDRTKYLEQDNQRRADYEAHKWLMLFVAVTIRVNRKVVGEASLFGIESDSGDDYFREIEREMMDEAEADMRTTISRLMSESQMLKQAAHVLSCECRNMTKLIRGKTPNDHNTLVVAECRGKCLSGRLLARAVATKLTNS